MYSPSNSGSEYPTFRVFSAGKANFSSSISAVGFSPKRSTASAFVIQTQNEILNIISNKKGKHAEDLKELDRCCASGEKLCHFTQFFCHDLSLSEFTLITFLFLENNQFDSIKAAKSMTQVAMHRKHQSINKICFFPSCFAINGYALKDVLAVLGMKEEKSPEGINEHLKDQTAGNGVSNFSSPSIPVDLRSSQPYSPILEKKHKISEKIFLDSSTSLNSSILPSTQAEELQHQNQDLNEVLTRGPDSPVLRPVIDKANTSSVVKSYSSFLRAPPSPSLPLPLLSSSALPGDTMEELRASCSFWKLPGRTVLRAPTILSTAAKYSTNIISSVVSSTPFSPLNANPESGSSEIIPTEPIPNSFPMPNEEKHLEANAGKKDTASTDVPQPSTLFTASVPERGGGKKQLVSSLADTCAKESSPLSASPVENGTHGDPCLFHGDVKHSPLSHGTVLSRFRVTTTSMVEFTFPPLLLTSSASSMFQPRECSSTVHHTSSNTIYLQYLMQPLVNLFGKYMKVAFHHHDLHGRPLMCWNIHRGAETKKLSLDLLSFSSSVKISVPNLYQLYFTTLLETAQLLVRYNHRRKWGKEKECMILESMEGTRFFVQDAITSAFLIVTLPSVAAAGNNRNSTEDKCQLHRVEKGEKSALYRKESAFLRAMLKIMCSDAENYYPSLIHRIIVFYSGSHLPFSKRKFLFRIRNSIQQKIIFCEASEKNEEITESIPKEYIPFLLGGTCKCITCRATGRRTPRSSSDPFQPSRQDSFSDTDTALILMSSSLPGGKVSGNEYSENEEKEPKRGGKERSTSTAPRKSQGAEDLQRIEKELHIPHSRRAMTSFSLQQDDSVGWSFTEKSNHSLFFTVSFLSALDGTVTEVVPSTRTSQMTKIFTADLPGSLIFVWKNPSLIAFSGRDVFISLRRVAKP